MESNMLHLSFTYLDNIQSAYHTFNSKEKQIADFICQNGAKCQHLSARELADACQCSAATVVRFARKLNYSGYSELKYHIRAAGSQVSQDDITLSSVEGIPSMTQKALKYATLSLKNTVEGVDDNTLELAARAILGASTIQLCAMGSASGVALSACSQFLSFGIRASYPMDELQQLRTAACLRKGDVLIGINYNNAAKNVADAFMAAKKNGATTILITAVKTGILSRYADLVFYTPPRRTGNSLNISTTTLCQSMILQLLILRIWQLDPARFSQESTRIRDYTKLKLYDPSQDRLTVSHNKL